MSSASAAVLAETLLTRVTLTEKPGVILNVASRLENVQLGDDAFSIARLTAELIQQLPEYHFTDRVKEDVSLCKGKKLLLEFLFYAIEHEVLGDDLKPVHQAIVLSLRHEWILDSMLSAAAESLEMEVEPFKEPGTLPKTARTIHQIVQSLHFTGLQRRERGTQPESPSTPSHVLKWMAFLRILYGSCASAGQRPYFEHSFLCVLVLLMSSIPEIVTAARNTFITMLSATRGGTTNPRREAVWHMILEMTLTRSSFKSPGSDALMIWLQILVSPNPFVPSSITLRDPSYWSAIKENLVHGSQEQQKTCLSILRVSLTHIRQDVDLPFFTFLVIKKSKTEVQYEKYCTLFETVVLGRYLNQVQDCIGDFHSLLAPSSTVHKSFMIALLTSALHKGMQDSVKKVIGSWTLQNAPILLVNSPADLPKFLSHSFLPWATQGHLYVATTRKDMKGQITCSFGETLAACLKDILTGTTKSEDRNKLVESVISFISTTGSYIFPFSRAFVLEGLLSGLQAAPVHIGEEEVSRLVKMAAPVGFADVVRDLSIVQCAKLSSFAVFEVDKSFTVPLTRLYTSLTQVTDDANARLAQALAYFESFDSNSHTHAMNNHEDTRREEFTFERFIGWLEITKSKCLRGQGVQMACAYLFQALQQLHKKMASPEHLIRVLEALLDETEIQDYARQIVMKLPALLFHDRCVELCSESPALTQLLFRAAQDLQHVAEQRTYAFTPLAHALHRAILGYPEAAGFLYVEFVLWYANSPPSTKVEHELEAVMAVKLGKDFPQRTYISYYGKEASEGHATVFDMLNRLPVDFTTQNFDVIDTLLEQWINQPKPVPVHSKWKTTAQLQVLLILCEQVLTRHAGDRVDYYIKTFLELLADEPLPRYRFLFEWLTVRIFVRIPERRYEILTLLSALDNSNPKYNVSIMKIAQMVARLEDTNEEFITEFMTQLIVLAANPKIIIRHEAQWMFPLLWDDAVRRKLSSLYMNPAFSRLNTCISSSKTYKHPPHGRLLKQFDPILDHTLTELFEGNYFQIEPEEPKRTTRDAFITVQRDLMSDRVGTFNAAILTPTMPLGDAKKPESQAVLTTLQESPTFILSSEPAPFVPLQTKSALSHFTDAALAYSQQASSRRQVKPLIVIASLIDNEYNLGGISRISEIFGVQCLLVKSLNVAKNKDFTSVSVSSHLHLPIKELDIAGIPDYLTSCKLDGWTVVGVEQTDSSKILGSEECVLPKKAILVLGSEQKGIPAMLLSRMDLCVEISQVGVTRSMNVQTAAAIALYEFSKQHP